MFRRFGGCETKPKPNQRTNTLNKTTQKPDSSHGFMNSFLDSQMFERFLEERTSNTGQPEVRFFDESIAAKLNRSKTNPIKKDTPFLNDQSDSHNQVSRRKAEVGYVRV